MVDALDEIYRLMNESQAVDVHGDTYEYLLSKIAQSGLNGQFRTPRHIIRMMVELMEQKFIALSATKNKMSVSLRGKVKNIGKKHLDAIFEKNPYMKSIYPGDTRAALEVFRIYEAQGEYFDISNPSQIARDRFTIGNAEKAASGYFIGNECNQCGLCYSACPQTCIDISKKPAVINQNHCLHCGRCAEICPHQAIQKVG